MTNKPLVLAVETSSRIGSVAIAHEEKILAETSFSAPLRHSAEIFPAICNLLDRFNHKPDQIGQVHISSGPGSFTGLRIAVTIAKTMYLAHTIKIVKVDTLDVIAANIINFATENTLKPSNHESPITNRERFATILDAKRGQFFIAVYERKVSDNHQETKDGNMKKITHDSLMTASEFLDRFACNEEPIRLLGDGLLYHKDKFKTKGTQFLDEQYWSPRASKVHLLGWKKAIANQFTDPMTLIPNYLLRPDIKIKPR